MSEAAKNYLEQFDGAAWLENITNEQLEIVAAKYWQSYWDSFNAKCNYYNSLK
jgi:hypothetical protein